MIKVFDFAEDDLVCPGYNYMVMEYCKFDLAHLIGLKHEALDIQYIKYVVGVRIIFDLSMTHICASSLLMICFCLEYRPRHTGMPRDGRCPL